MPETTSPWRVNDVVAYDRMRDTATIAFALLQAAARANGPKAEAARQELTALRREVLGVEAYDRAAVAAVAARLEDRIRVLQGTTP